MTSLMLSCDTCLILLLIFYRVFTILFGVLVIFLLLGVWP